jgi:hypothetical protein
MEEIDKECQSRTLKAMQEYQLEQYTDNPFLNSAIGYILFARDLPHLFRFLYFERPEPISRKELKELKKRLPKELRDLALDYFRKITPKELNDVALLSWIFTHGLAVLLYSGVLTNISNKEIVSVLEKAGNAFFALENIKKKESRIK